MSESNEGFQTQNNIDVQKKALNKNAKCKFAIIIIIAVFASFLGGLIGSLIISTNNMSNPPNDSVSDLANEALKKAENAERIALSSMTSTRGSVAVLDLASPGGYSNINNDNGQFYLMFEEVVLHPNGSKLILKIGNPSNVTYSGFELTAKWPYVLINEEKKNQKSKTQSYSQDLKPGMWNRVEFILPGKLPDSIEFTMDTDRLSLKDY